MRKKTALGRGLDALFPAEEAAAQVKDIALNLIDPDPNQPRRAFDKESLEELAASIREVGLLQPILAEEKAGRYQIIAGERRFRAAMLAGLKTIPCLVKQLSPKERSLAALIENLQREDLNPMEAARAVRRLMDEGNYTQEQAAGMLGKSRPAVANLLRLLQLNPAVQEMLMVNQLTEGHARVLAGIKNQATQLSLARRVAAEGLSVRALEAIVKKPQAKPGPAPIPQAPELAAFEERLREALGVRAAIKGNMKKGKVVLSYASFEELEHIYEAVERLLG
jgi:ParB family chromosome partitioning protein